MTHTLVETPVTTPEQQSRPVHDEAQRELSRLATLQNFDPEVSFSAHTNKDVRFTDVVMQNTDERVHYHVAYGGVDRSAEFARDPEDAHEKTAVLYTIAGAIQQEAKKQAVSESIDWDMVANDLLAKANDEQGSDRRNSLVGAVISAQFTGDPRQRMDFVQKVYDKGLQDEMSEACEASALFLVVNEVDEQDAHRIHKVQRFAKTFEASPANIERYAEEVVQATPHEDLPSDKRIQKEIIASYEEAPYGDEELSATAEEASTSTEKLNSTLTDLHKVERFALEQMFIKRQMQDVLKGLKEGDTALGRNLVSRRQESDVAIDKDLALGIKPTAQDELIDPGKVLRAKVSRLEVDVSQSFRELSKPAKEAFSIEGVNPATPETWTRSQAAAMRFKDVTKLLAQDVSFGAFVDIDRFVEEAEENPLFVLVTEGMDISTLSEDGAAVPEFATALVQNVMTGVLSNPDLHTATPEELRDFAHANRRSLLRAATHHIQELAGVEQMTSDDIVLRRNDQGTLEMLNAPSIPAKGSLDFYSAILLGCPALRLQHEDRPAMSLAERAAHGSSNYIDHAAAAIINEAYERGIFDIKTFSKRPSELPKPTSPPATIAAYL
jgi:hypothetical protein